MPDDDVNWGAKFLGLSSDESRGLALRVRFHALAGITRRMRLYLIRHAQTAWNLLGRAQGSTDIELDETGRRQARLLALRLASAGPMPVFSSDLRRCLQTSEAIAQAGGGEVVPDPRLRERSGGSWEGLSFDEFRRRLREGQGADDPHGLQVRPEDGESVQDVWERLEPVARALQERAESAAVVSHGGASALLLARLLGADIVAARAFRFANAAVTELSRNGWGLFTLDRYNCTAHLEESALAGSLDGTIR